MSQAGSKSGPGAYAAQQCSTARPADALTTNAERPGLGQLWRRWATFPLPRQPQTPLPPGQPWPTPPCRCGWPRLSDSPEPVPGMCPAANNIGTLLGHTATGGKVRKMDKHTPACGSAPAAPAKRPARARGSGEEAATKTQPARKQLEKRKQAEVLRD